MRLIYGTFIELSIYMMSKERAKVIKHSLVVDSLSVCKTILQSSGRVALSSLLILSMVSCGPGGSQGPTQYITNYGSDKKLPDDDGYTGSGGTGDGGGGQGILCSAEVKNPEYRSKLFVRDIFEGIYNSKLKMKSMSGPSGEGSEQVSPESIKFLISTLKSFFGPAMQQLEIGREEFWQDFVSKISFLEEDVRLYPSQDANSPIALPNGCKIVQIAYWDDSTGRAENGTLYIDRERWKKLDSLNKIALLAHEYFFKEARRVGFTNSDLIRNRLGYLFSEKSISPMFPNDAKVTRYCTGKNQADLNAKIHIFYTEGPKNHQLIIPYISSSALGISSLHGRSFTVMQDIGEQLGAITTNGEYSHPQYRSNDIIWSGYLPSPSSNIKLSLGRPFKATKVERHNVPREAIPAKILEKIRESIEVSSRRLLRRNIYLDDNELTRAYLVLNDEIEAFRKQSIYPTQFPRWTSELVKLVNPTGDTKAKNLAGQDVILDYPLKLYKFHIGVLSESEVESLIPPQIFHSTEQQISDKDMTPKAIVEKDNRSYEYELSCYDSEAIAISQEKNNLLSGPPIRVANNETPVYVPYQMDESTFIGTIKTTDEKGQEDPWGWARETDDSEESEQEKFKSKIQATLRNAFHGYIESRPKCDLTTIDDCTPAQRLGYKLRRTKYAVLHRCHDYDNFQYSPQFEVIEEHRVRARRCLVIEIPEEKMYYMVKQEGAWAQELNRYSFYTEVIAVGPPTYPAKRIKEAGSP